MIFLQYRIWKKLEEDPLFQQGPQSLPLQEFRKLTALRANRIRDYDFFNFDKIMENPQRVRETSRFGITFEKCKSNFFFPFS